MRTSNSTTEAPAGVRSPSRGRLRVPSGRALIGALLVVAAAGGVLMSHRSATQPALQRYLVPSRDLPAGHSIAADDLGAIGLDLPAELGVLPAELADDVTGRVLRHGVAALDLLRPGDLLESGRFNGPGQLEVALDLPAARALAGSVGVGDRVDVLVTDPSAVGTTTLTRATVVAVDGDEASGIGTTSNARVRLSVSDPTTAELLVDAAVRSELTLALPAPSDERPAS